MSELPENLKFKIEARWDKKTGANIRFESDRSLIIDTPTEFGGRGTALCPDELFLTSIAGCVLTTFLWFTRKRGVKINDMRLDAESEIELIKGAYSFKAIRITIEISAPEEYADKAKTCLDLAIRYCHISRGIEHCIPIDVTGKVIVS